MILAQNAARNCDLLLFIRRGSSLWRVTRLEDDPFGIVATIACAWDAPVIEVYVEPTQKLYCAHQMASALVRTLQGLEGEDALDAVYLFTNAAQMMGPEFWSVYSMLMDEWADSCLEGGK